MTFDPSTDWRALLKMTPIQLEHWKEQAAAKTSRILYDGDLETAAALQKAGWTPEPLYTDSAMYQWRWRRPGPRGGTLFLSPTQALSALRKGRR